MIASNYFFALDSNDDFVKYLWTMSKSILRSLPGLAELTNFNH
jgi:hypothetical protein